MKPDLCVFSEKVDGKLIMKYGKYFAHFGFVELFVEVKANPARNNPFQKPKRGKGFRDHHFIRKNDSNGILAHNIGQITSYAVEICARQHRTHCFSICIYGTGVRLFRWDRAGVIVSDEFDLHENPELLCLFAWRYSHATDAQRGFDMTVTKATCEEELKFKDVITKHIKDQLSPSNGELADLLKKHYEPSAVFKISVVPRQSPEEKAVPSSISKHTNVVETLPLPYPWDEVWEKEAGTNGDDLALAASSNCVDTPAPSAKTAANGGVEVLPKSRSREYIESQYFLVSIPVSTPLTIATRGTRGYWSVKIPDETLEETDHVIAFLKDTWRINVGGMEIEGEVNIELIEAGVRFVSDIFCHGDVPDVSAGQGESK